MSNLIQRKASARYPGLYVLKYKKKVFFNNLWDTDASLLEARGHVEDAGGNVVVRPFTKIYNRFEQNTDIDRDEGVVAVKKINGFMAAATFVPIVNEVVVSTTGSLDSDFIAYAEKYINDHVKAEILADYKASNVLKTWLFEICHQDDPHIIVEQAGAYLIGCREVADESPYFSTPVRESMLDDFATRVGVYRPEWSECRFSDLVKLANSCDHEGFVVYGQSSGTVLKIKSKYYLVQKMFARKKDIMSANKQVIDEEFFELVDHLMTIRDEFNAMDEQDRLIYMRNFLEKE